MNAELRRGLHGLVDQIPESWTAHRRELFIAAFTSVLDFSVSVESVTDKVRLSDATRERTHEELPRSPVESTSPRIPVDRHHVQPGEYTEEDYFKATEDGRALGAHIRDAVVAEAPEPAGAPLPAPPTPFGGHVYEPHPDYGKVCKVCGLSEGWREHIKPEPERPEATPDDQLVEKLEQSVENIEAKRFVCPECNRAFPTNQGLAGHRRFIHEGRNPMGKTLAGEPTRIVPKAQKHPMDGVAQPGEAHTSLEEAQRRWEPKAEPQPVRIAAESQKPFACKCGEEFDANSDLIRHLNSKESAANRKQHHIVRQPRAAMVPSGMPARVNENAARRAAYSEVGPENAS